MLPSSRGTVGFPAAAGSRAPLLKHKYVCSPRGSKSPTSKTLGGPLHSGGANPIPNPHIPLRFHCLFQSVRARHLPPETPPKDSCASQTRQSVATNVEKNHSTAKCLQPRCQNHGPAAVPRERCFLRRAARTWLTETDCGFTSS